MDGLNSNRIIDQFSKDIKSLENNWGQLTSGQRQNSLQTSLNKSLNSAGLPSIKIELKQFPAQLQGQFDFHNWKMYVNEDLIKDSKLSPEEASNLAQTIYHEARHGEQFYRVAELLASNPPDGQKRTPQEIAKQLQFFGVPGITLAQQAAQTVQKNPLSSEQIIQARAWYQSVYGKDSQREQVLKNLYSTSQTFSLIEKVVGKATNAYIEHKKSYESQVKDYDEKSKIYQGAVAKLERQLKSGQDHQLSPTEASKYLGQLTKLEQFQTELTKYSIQLDIEKQDLDKEYNNLKYKLEPAYENAKAAADKAYNGYTSLPEEADAFKIQVPVQEIYKGRVQYKSEAKTSTLQAAHGLLKDSTTPIRSVPVAPTQPPQTNVAHAAQLSLQELKNLSPAQLLSAANAVQKWQQSEPRLDYPQGSDQLSKGLGSLVQKQANLTEQHQHNTKILKEVQQQGVRSLFNPFGASIEKNNEAQANYHTTRGNLERVGKEIVQVKSQINEARSQEAAHQKWSENPQHKTFETLAHKLKQPELEAKVDKLQAGMSYFRQWESVANVTGKPWIYMMQIHDIREDYLQGKPIPQEIVQEMKQQLGQYKVQKELETASR
jgi:hypothetical protein